MRPRIKPEEAKYIAELLQTSLEILKEHENWVKELEFNCYELDLLKRYDWVNAQKQGQKEKAKELDYWNRNLARSTSYHKRIHEALIKKYSDLANRVNQPQAHHNNSIVNRQFLKGYDGTLKEALEKKLTPLDELGHKERLFNV